MAKQQNKKQKKTAQDIIFDIVGYIIMAVSILFLALTLVSYTTANISGERPYVFGYSIIRTTSGSMEPTILTNGSAICKKVTKRSDIKPGDIITFKGISAFDDEHTERVTHRIIRIANDGLIYTKGDNNDVEDSHPISFDAVESKVVLVVNFTAAIFGNNPIIVMTGIIICVIDVVLIREILRTSVKSKRKRKGKRKSKIEDTNDANITS